jgi:uncharacterized protein YkwD
MQERRPARRWPLVAALVSVLALVAGTATLSHVAGAHSDATVTGRAAPADASASTRSLAQPRGVPNDDFLPSGARHGHAPPSLIDSLRAARILSDAGLLPPPPQPPLAEILLAVAALAKAGALPPVQPTMSDVLSAVRVLAAAGALPPLPHAPVAGPPPQAPPVAPPPSPTPVPPVPPAAAPPPGAAPGWYDDAFSQRVRDLVNQQRAQGGLAPVAPEPRLATAASGYAKLLSDYHWFAHVGPDGSTFISRIEAAGVPFNVQFGEILAWGTQNWPPESIVQAWMDSPTHREEIMSPAYRRAGARCYFTAPDGITVYCVMDFAG